MTDDRMVICDIQRVIVAYNKMTRIHVWDSVTRQLDDAWATGNEEVVPLTTGRERIRPHVVAYHNRYYLGIAHSVQTFCQRLQLYL